ncbi:MAG: TIGR02452 family protein [Pirellula sp.]
MSNLRNLPCLDSDALAANRRRELAIQPELAESLGRSAVESIELGYYLTDDGKVDWSEAVRLARESKVSIAQGTEFPSEGPSAFAETMVQVANETTLGAAKRLVDGGKRPLALNFANGAETGGGFLRGATAQEEALCRSSALYATLVDDPMYDFHRDRELWAESSEWAILSPNVPVFRDDRGMELDQPWLLSFITCAAPYAPSVGQPRSSDLLRGRILRVLSIARAFGYAELVLGAWGCGAFGNDPMRTARDFRNALEGEFQGAFREVVFAITDWSPDRRFLGPFRDAFSD